MQHPKSEYQLRIESLEEWQKAQRGELYLAFIPELVAARDRCTALCDKFNTTSDRSRRSVVKIWREISLNSTPLPPPPATTTTPPSDHPTNTSTPTPHISEDDLFTHDPWICAPIHIDYGFNVHLGPGVFINFNSTFVDTCPIVIGARTLVGPNCSFYSGTHPLDPAIRMGTEGPESGKPIEIGEDCWIGGNVIVLAGVKVGKGSTVGAGSVVTKDVPPLHVVAGNPARILRKIESSLESITTTSATTPS